VASLFDGLLNYSSTLKMEAIRFSETSGATQRTIWCHIPEDDALHNHRCENLKSYTDCMFEQWACYKIVIRPCHTSVTKRTNRMPQNVAHRKPTRLWNRCTGAWSGPAGASRLYELTAADFSLWELHYGSSASPPPQDSTNPLICSCSPPPRRGGQKVEKCLNFVC
jgi:hypothetical protein